MKNFLFLGFLGLSYFSLGQTQETLQKNVDPQPIQQKISKVNKIDKRVKPIRTKDKEIPLKNNEAVKPN